jgi:aminoglycoside phosphotransferase
MIDLDIPTFLRIPQEVRRESWRGRKLTKPKAASVKIAMGSKMEVPGLARHVRFTLGSRHHQPAPACPFGAKERTRFAGARCARSRVAAME